MPSRTSDAPPTAIGDDAFARRAQAWCDAAQARWTFPIDRAAMLAVAAQRVGTDGPDGVDRLDGGELALALACAAGDAAALASFDRDYVRAAAAGLGHMRLDAATIDEVLQRTRTRLLVAEPGATARLVDYAGTGRLRGLVQVVAARIAVDLTRAARPHHDAPDHDLAAVADDPELSFLKASYRAAWQQAFTAAVGELDARARNLLHLHHLSGVTLEQLATMYQVHRATVVRWLGDARGRLLRGTRTRLTQTLSVSATELDSILALIASRLEASVGRLLADDGDGHGSETSAPADRRTET